jgi:hypothetical protein
MGTAKSYQHQGAATLQVEEFDRIADELNAVVRNLLESRLWSRSANRGDLQMTTESTTAARWLYEKNGYVLSEHPGHYVIEATLKEFAARPKDRLFFMERPRAG